MREIDRIERQLRCSIEGDAWHGPAVRELICDVDAEQARSRPISGAHSIWELTLHVTTWMRAGIDGIAGDTIDYPPELDWPEAQSGGEEAWRQAVQELEDTYEKLCKVMAEMEEGRLEDVVTGKPYNLYTLLHGVVQHNLYHAGQIALLKKCS